MCFQQVVILRRFRGGGVKNNAISMVQAHIRLAIVSQ